MCAILHFFGEDIHRIAFPSDVKNPDGLVLDKFPDRVFAEFHVTDTLGGKVVRPLDTGHVVVEDRCRRGGVWQREAHALEIFNKVCLCVLRSGWLGRLSYM